MIRSPFAGVIRPNMFSLFEPLGELTPDFYAPLRGNTALVKGVGAATFTRNLKAFYYDSKLGKLIEVSANVARFEDNGYLNEESRQNLIGYDSNFNPAVAWTVEYAYGYTADDEVAPDGTLTADKLQDADSVNNTNFYKLAPALASTAHVIAVHIKKRTQVDYDANPYYPCMMYHHVGGSGKSGLLFLHPATGEIVLDSSDGWIPSSYGVESVGDYWRIWVVATTEASLTGVRCRVLPGAGGAVDPWPNVGLDGVTQYFHHCWGAAVVPGAFLTSHIKNDAGTLFTRPADSLKYQVAGNLLVNDCSGTFDYTPKATASGLGTDIFWGSRVDGSNLTDMLISGTSLIFRKRIAGTDYAATIPLSYVKGVTYKIGWRLSSTKGIDIWVDGVKGTGDPDVTDAQLNTYFGIGGDDQTPPTNPSTAWFKELKFYHKDLTDAQMQRLLT